MNRKLFSKTSLVLILLTIITCSIYSQLNNKVILSTVKKEFFDGDSIKAYVKNNSKHSIYFQTAWPLPNIKVLRFNNELKVWEMGEQYSTCFNVGDRDKPIEIKSGDSISIDLINYIEVDSIHGFPLFRLEYLEKYRPIYGRYKLRLLYAKEYWTFIHEPKKIYSVESPEFLISYRSRK